MLQREMIWEWMQQDMMRQMMSGGLQCGKGECLSLKWLEWGRAGAKRWGLKKGKRNGGKCGKGWCLNENGGNAWNANAWTEIAEMPRMQMREGKCVKCLKCKCLTQSAKPWNAKCLNPNAWNAWNANAWKEMPEPWNANAWNANGQCKCLNANAECRNEGCECKCLNAKPWMQMPECKCVNA